MWFDPKGQFSKICLLGRSPIYYKLLREGRNHTNRHLSVVNKRKIYIVRIYLYINMKKTLKEALIGAGATLTVYVNDTQIVPKLTESAPHLVNDARNLDHLLAGVGAPYIIGLSSKPIEKYLKIPAPNKFLAYATCAVYWETKQAVERGSFQFDQFACDMVRLGIAYAVDKFLLKDK